MNARQRKRAHRNTRGATCSTDWVSALREANRHIEALAVVRKDNSWDMIAARGARDEIIEAMSNAGSDASASSPIASTALLGDSHD